MKKPKFNLENMTPHPSLGKRITLMPVNPEAWQMIFDRNDDKIPDFPLVIYQEPAKEFKLNGDMANEFNDSYPKDEDDY